MTLSRRALRNVRWMMAAGLMAVVMSGCSLDSLLKNDEIPPGVTDPTITKTPQGALAAYYGALALLQDAFGQHVVASSGLIADELQSGWNLGVQDLSPEDLRALPEVSSSSSASGMPHWDLQQVRGQAGQAIGLLTAYSPDRRALIGHAYTIEAYAELFLAELYCSGIPLSTLDYDGDYTLKSGSTMTQVLQHAVVLFDSALALSADSMQFVQLAAVGKGRALLDLGNYADAGMAVAGVPDAFRYAFIYSAMTDGTANFAQVGEGLWRYTVADREGNNGMDFISSGDPRSAATIQGTNGAGYHVYTADKYSIDGSSPIVLASGIEARLIQAEAALQAGDVPAWLNALNRLRTDGTSSVTADTVADTLGVTGCGAALCGDGLPDANYSAGGGSTPDYGQPPGGFQPPAGYALADSTVIDPVSDEIRDHCYNNSWYLPCYVDVNNPSNGRTTVYLYVSSGGSGWGAGVGGVANLAPLTDPGTTAGRIDLMFRERAFWLFLTGHRQGDLRRLIRQYGRPQNEVFPVGAYPSIQGVPYQYGDDVTFPPPADERVSNPLYSGCFSRDA